MFKYTSQSTLDDSWQAPECVSGVHTTRDFIVVYLPEHGDDVLGRYDPTPGLPGSPDAGDSHIATATANGWTIEYLYIYNGTTWEEEIPHEGHECWIKDENHDFVFDGSAWQKALELPIDGELNFTYSPTYNGLVDVLGWYQQIDTAESLTSASPVTASEKGFHSHFVIDVSSASGLPFTVRITGRSVDEADGTETGSDTEDISVTANGYHQSIKSWIDDVQFSIVEGSKSCTIDIYRITYWDRGNREFTVTGVRMEFQPDNPAWSINLRIRKVLNDGSSADIDNVTFANTDTYPRAADGEPGKYKRTDFNTFVDGRLAEGIIIEVNQTAIENIYLEVRYDK